MSLILALFIAGCGSSFIYEPLHPLEVRLRPGGEILLDGSGSFDPAGEELLYRWRQVEGPTVEILDADTPWPRFVPAQPGRYVFELTVEAGEGEGLVSDPVRLSVDVLPPNRPPEVVVERRLSAEPGQWVALDGGRTTDPDGDLMTFLWERVDGPPVEMRPADGRARTIFVLARQAGDYRFRLTATDAHGLSKSAEADLLVRPRRQPPVAVPRLGQPEGPHLDHYPVRLTAWPHLKGGANLAPVAAATVSVDKVDDFFLVEIDATGSHDANGDALRFTWRQVGGPLIRTLFPDREAGLGKVSFDVVSRALYAFELVVDDGTLASDPLLVEVPLGSAVAEERPAWSPPEPETDHSLAADSGEDIVVELGEEFVLVARGRYGTGTLFDWRQIDGPRLTHFRMPGIDRPGQLAIDAREPGRYTFALRVSTDSIRWSPPSLVSATVLAPNRAPEVVLPERMTVRPGALVRVSAIAGDVDGEPLLVEWSATGAEVFESGLACEIIAPDSGRATVRCTVRDPRGGEASGTIEIVVADNRDPPIASVLSPASARVGEVVRLDASHSCDSEGGDLRYEWTALADGSLRPRGSVASYRPNSPGRHIIEVVAESGGRRSAVAAVEIDVELPPSSQTRYEAMGPGDLVEVGRPVVLHAPEASRTGARWEAVSRPDKDEPVETFDGRAVVRPKAIGGYVFRLVDGEGRPVSRAFGFTAVESVGKPAARADISVEGRTVTMDAGRSRGRNGSLWFRWEQIAGPRLDLDWKPTQAPLVQVDAQPGEYAVRLVAMNGGRVARSETRRFVVNATAR